VSRTCTACALLVGLIGGSAFGGAESRVNLVVSAISLSQHGGSLQIKDAVRNVGRTSAAPSTISYYIAGRRIGGRSVRALRPGAVSRASKTLRIPSVVPPGSWRFRACVGVQSNCRVAARRVVVGDVTPPRFDGLLSATTCIPGPVGGTTRYSRYGLKWNPATDNATPASDIVYDIYEAHAVGAEDFAKPTYTTQPGATTFATPPLPDNVSHYFVVRAVDQAGNRDRNKVERLGENLCV
jgi:hypothetical protein